MIKPSLSRAVVLIAVAGVLGACAVGQTVGYSGTSVGLQNVNSSGSVAVAVHDVRSYIVSGNKPEKFVGLMRGGFGNPFDVNTGSGQPLSGEMGDALVASLKKKGITATRVTMAPSYTAAQAKSILANANARRQVLVTLREWKSDSMMNTALHYDVVLDVMDERGIVLASNKIGGTDNLGSVGMGPADEVAKAFGTKFDALFNDPKVAAALK